MPQNALGMRIEPPPSLPCATAFIPDAMELPAPPLDPPLTRSAFQGLRQSSPSLFSVVPDMPNSGVFVLPRMIMPASFMRRTPSWS